MRYIGSNHQGMYNRLSSTIISAQRLQAKADFQAALAALGSLIESAGLGDILQIRLLHRHHALDRGEAMIEILETEDGERVLSTQSHKLAEVTEECVPSIWRPLPNGDIEAHEFGDARLYAISHGFFEENRDLFAKFAHMLEEVGLTDVLGLCLFSDALSVDPRTHLHAEFVEPGRTFVKRFPKDGLADMVGVYESTWNSRGVTSGECRSCVITTNPYHTHDTVVNTHFWGDTPEKEEETPDEALLH